MPSVDLFSAESINRDLDTEKPIWPLSSFGPAKMQPNLIAGLDESPEEMRVRAAQVARAGTMQEYVRPFPSSLSPSEHQTIPSPRHTTVEVRVGQDRRRTTPLHQRTRQHPGPARTRGQEL